ncbi:glycosyltransferase family 2 protein [Pontibacter burrus]|uniref:Glycosyltransferase family 2 protein n=1 Tax=Pontibacter burrus TaxID=2704466 RepID=A0A6B3LZH5_9BACT|nr:glycosyltransferase family 2 protein [Pontibacter burrus]NEM98894.1 glycosyltransferase family 2 protein [Pontibacter burrus]
MDKPFFSVIIPTHNRPTELLRAVGTVINQTYKSFEIIIVNDGSTVDYSEIEDQVQKHSSIKYIKQENKYLAGARNTGIENANGNFICFLDDDDIYYEHHLAVLYNSIKRNFFKDAFYHTRCYLNRNGVRSKSLPRTYINGSSLSHILDDPFPVHTVCLPSSILKFNKFNEDLRYMEDRDLWIRLSKLLPVIKINKYTVEYIFHENNMVSWNLKSQMEKLRTFNYFNKTYKTYLPSKYLLTSLIDLNLAVADLSVPINKRAGIKYIIEAIKLSPVSVLKRKYFYAIIRSLFLS